MAPQVERDAGDLVDVLMERVKKVARGAERKYVTSAHAWSFAREVVGQRRTYWRAMQTFRCVYEEDRDDLFLAEVRRVYAAKRALLAHAENRTDLLGEWIDLLVKSLDAVHEELGEPAAARPRTVPFHELFDEEDLAVLREDREEEDWGARGVAEAWRS